MSAAVPNKQLRGSLWPPDPRLAFAQAMVAITLVMSVVFNLANARDLALPGCLLVFLLGTSYLDARSFRLATLYALAAYALVIDLQMFLRPERVPDPRLAWVSWLMLATVLPCFAFICVKAETTRRRMLEIQDRFRRLTAMSSDFFWESDASHRMVAATAAHGTGRLPPFRQRPLPGVRRWEVPSMSPDEAGWAAHRADLDAHRPFRGFEMSRMGTDGAERHVSLSGEPFTDPSGEFAGFRGVGTDITDRKRAEAALAHSAKEMRLLADSMPAMMVSWGRDRRCRFANQSFSTFNGLDPKAIVGKRVEEIMGEELCRVIEPHIAQALRGEPATYRAVREVAGSRRHIEVRLIPNIGSDGEVVGCFSVSTDITEHMLAQQRIEKVAHHDELTGLPNRLLFRDRLGRALDGARRDGGRVALLYLDLDRFKSVNDVHGHAMGDDLLNAVADRIREVVRESDTVARLGGDEFAVVLPAVQGPEVARLVGAKIDAALGLPFRLGDPVQEVRIGSSIGLAMYPEDGIEVEDLLRAADRAMYSVKQAGPTLPFAA